jgi:two-component system chemotaxis sensor kinase CheA
LPFIDLNQLYATGGTVGGRQAVIVVAADDDQVGLMVDELVGEYQTVIKPLGPLFRRVVGIGGSTILGSGEVALILDVPALVGMVRRQADGGQPAARAGASEAMKEVA